MSRELKWIDDAESDDMDGEGKSRNDGEEDEDAVDDRARATVVDPARRDSRIFEHAFDDCFDRAGQNPDCPRSIFAVSAPAARCRPPADQPGGGEEDAVARSGMR